jgi:hypothetical protein|tara:strand:- start:1556 stop:2368 length:813 start_codon:yes stop_codon:yes gene_type:complete
MKHNKKRNTAFIYETLIRELTKTIVAEQRSKKQQIMAIVKEHFGPQSVLQKELVLYRTLLETTNLHPHVAERLLQETKRAHSNIDVAATFDAQSQIISAMNKELGQEIWSNFVPNFKSLASVNAIFSTKTALKKKVLFEQSVVDHMSAHAPLAETQVLQSIDNLTYHSFIKKFNNKYGDLLQEQKDLLSRFITSFADEGLELRVYLNEELTRLKKEVLLATEVSTEALMVDKLQGITEYLEEFRKREFTDIDLNKILKTQELVQELTVND